MKIALVGGHPSKRAAPFDDPSWTIWSCSERNYAEVPRADLWFELHLREAIDGNGPYLAFLRAHPAVLMRQRFADIPGSRRLPLETLTGRFGRCFFQGTPCYMAAQALASQPVAIGLWGIEGRFPEYARQRQALQHFVWLAEQQGIAVTCPDDLLAAPLYAFEET